MMQRNRVLHTALIGLVVFASLLFACMFYFESQISSSKPALHPVAFDKIVSQQKSLQHRSSSLETVITELRGANDEHQMLRSKLKEEMDALKMSMTKLLEDSHLESDAAASVGSPALSQAAVDNRPHDSVRVPPVETPPSDARAPSTARVPPAATQSSPRVGQATPTTRPPVATTQAGTTTDDELQFLVSRSGYSADTSTQFSGPLTTWATTKPSFPIVLMCYNRPAELKRTILSLLDVHGVTAIDILVVQDGEDAAVAGVVQEFGLASYQHVVGYFGKKVDGGMRIANHYKFSIQKGFDHFPDAPALIVVEDDFLFSTDFMQFFLSVAPAVENDPTLWIASAWNDNGFKGRVKDPKNVRRTDFFPGLGWMLPRALWETELARKWPKNHWDWFMRNPDTHKGRECVYPEVARDFHAGAKGTFMDPKTQHRYFDTIEYNKNPANAFAPLEASHSAMQSNYEGRIEHLLDRATVVANAMDLINAKEGIYVVWYEASLDPRREKLVKPFAEYFGIWHQLLRASHDLLHEVWFDNKLVLLINTADPKTKKKSIWFNPPKVPSKYNKLRKPGTVVFTPTAYMAQVAGMQTGSATVFSSTGYQIKGATETQAGWSCDEVCKSHSLACDNASMEEINTCPILQSHFTCPKGCGSSIGSDQPAMVVESAPTGVSPGRCLVNKDKRYYSCKGHFQYTRRLCPCVTV